MKKIICIGLLITLTLTGCGAQSNIEKQVTNDSAVTTKTDDKIENEKEKDNANGSWDRVIVLENDSYRLGDPISTLKNTAYTQPTEYLPYMAAYWEDSDGIGIAGINGYADNFSMEACTYDECILDLVSFTGETYVSKAFPGIPEMKDMDSFFGKENRLLDHKYAEDDRFFYEIDNYTIRVCGDDKNKYANQLDVYYNDGHYPYYSDFVEAFASKVKDVKDFQTGLTTFHLNNDEKFKNIVATIMNETGYCLENTFVYHLDSEREFNVKIGEINHGDVSEYDGKLKETVDRRPVSINGKEYFISTDFRDDTIIIWQFDNGIKIEVQREGWTTSDEMFVKFAEDFLSNITVD